jgi:hypothetical protein
VALLTLRASLLRCSWWHRCPWGRLGGVADQLMREVGSSREVAPQPPDLGDPDPGAWGPGAWRGRLWVPAGLRSGWGRLATLAPLARGCGHRVAVWVPGLVGVASFGGARAVALGQWPRVGEIGGGPRGGAGDHPYSRMGIQVPAMGFAGSRTETGASFGAKSGMQPGPLRIECSADLWGMLVVWPVGFVVGWGRLRMLGGGVGGVAECGWSLGLVGGPGRVLRWRRGPSPSRLQRTRCTPLGPRTAGQRRVLGGGVGVVGRGCGALVCTM